MQASELIQKLIKPLEILTRPYLQSILKGEVTSYPSLEAGEKNTSTPTANPATAGRSRQVRDHMQRSKIINKSNCNLCIPWLRILFPSAVTLLQAFKNMLWSHENQATSIHLLGLFQINYELVSSSSSYGFALEKQHYAPDGWRPL